jgi:RecG-like helicase
MGMGIHCADKGVLLAGRMRAKDKRELLSGLESGKIDVVVGTHACISEGVVYKRLGLAVIDEQHRCDASSDVFSRNSHSCMYCVFCIIS